MPGYIEETKDLIFPKITERSFEVGFEHDSSLEGHAKRNAIFRGASNQ
jgi:hypothetical protein